MSGKVPADWPFQFIDAVANEYDISKTLNLITEFIPEIIVCALAATNWTQDLLFIKTIRELFPEAYVFIYGDLFVDDSACLEVEGFHDGIFTSPAVFDFSELLNFRDRNSFKSFEHHGFRMPSFYTRSDLKSAVSITLKNIKHAHFVHPNYRWPFSRYFSYTTVFTAWGCPYSCSYCIMGKFPNHWRNFDEIIEEMESLKKSGIQEIYIGDRSFGFPYSNVVKLMEEMIIREFNFSWSTYLHPNQYTPELLDLMKGSGCHTIIVGIESQNIKSLKKFGRHVRESQFFKLIEHAQKINLNICGDFIIGLPEENKNDMEKTIQFALDLDIAYASFNIATPLPGSVIRAMAINNGQMSATEKEIDSFGRNKIVTVCKVDDKTLRKLRNKAVFKFYLRPKYIAKRLFDVKGVEHFLIQFQEAVLIIFKSLGLK